MYLWKSSFALDWWGQHVLPRCGEHQIHSNASTSFSKPAPTIPLSISIIQIVMTAATTTTNSQPAATLQVHPPNAKRRQPLAVRMGVHGLQEQQYRRSWTSQISKPLHCLKTFSGEQQSLQVMSRSSWTDLLLFFLERRVRDEPFWYVVFAVTQFSGLDK